MALRQKGLENAGRGLAFFSFFCYNETGKCFYRTKRLGAVLRRGGAPMQRRTDRRLRRGHMRDMGFPNTSVFIIPVLLDSFREKKRKFSGDARWRRLTAEELGTDYLMRYANRIAVDEACSASFVYLPLAEKPLSLRVGRETGEGAEQTKARNDKYEACVHPEELRLTLFDTGIGFAELQVLYDGLSPEEIVDFIYDFKKVYKTESDMAESRSFIGMVRESLGAGCTPFFYNPVNAGRLAFKNECLGFHALRFSESEIAPEEIAPLLFRLRHGYAAGFAYQENEEVYDFTYSPYAYDFWSGCQEGLANVVRLDEGKNAFIDRYKYRQLMRDYRFMYLILLNQRFTAIRYIEKISVGTDTDLDDVAGNIVKLKTVYSFRVISGDMLYQNIYRKMYHLLEIDELLVDLQDNEEKVSLYHKNAMEQSNDNATRMLLIISILSVFSCLIDAASYFELFQVFAGVAKWLSLGMVILASVFWGLFLFHNRKRKK